MKKEWIFIFSAAILFGLTGCGMDNNAADNGNNDARTARINNADNNNGNENNRLRISDRAADKVEQMREVEEANVIVSGNNAYVALSLADNGNGNNNAQNDNNNDGATQNGNNDGASNAIIDGKGDAGNNGNANTNAMENGQVKGDNNAGNQSGNTNDGDEAGNGQKNNNGNYSKVSNAFEQKVADQVRAADKKIHRVYVSTNPEVFDQMNDYTGQIQDGNNGNDLFDDFNNAVQGIFGR